MKIEWLVANVTPVGSRARAECDILGIILNLFWPITAVFVVVGGGTLWCSYPLLSSNDFTGDIY